MKVRVVGSSETSNKKQATSNYLINPGALVAKIFTAMASNITPKNLRTAIKPVGPNYLAIAPKDFKTINTITRLTRMAERSVISPYKTFVSFSEA